MKHKWLAILLFLSIAFFGGCGAETTQNSEDVWVIAEEISYNENGDATIRNVYEYQENQYNYRRANYEGERTPYYTEVTQSKDGKARTEKTYRDDTWITTLEQRYDKDGRILSEILTRFDGEEDKTEWKWSKNNTVAQKYIDGILVATEEYDEQGRKVYSIDNESETEIIYTEQERILRASFLDGSQSFYVVNKYDEQNRVIEIYNYTVNGAASYSEEDMTAYSMITYDEDEHSYWVKAEYNDGEVQMKSSMHVIYKPLSEMLK